MTLDEFLGLFDASGYFRERDGVVAVEIHDNFGHPTPSRLVFKAGLCIAIEAESGGWPKEVEGSLEVGAWFWAKFTDQVQRIMIDQGRVFTPTELEKDADWDVDVALSVARSRIEGDRLAYQPVLTMKPSQRRVVTLAIAEFADLPPSEWLTDKAILWPKTEGAPEYMADLPFGLVAFIRPSRPGKVELKGVANKAALQATVQQMRAEVGAP